MCATPGMSNARAFPRIDSLLRMRRQSHYAAKTRLGSLPCGDNRSGAWPGWRARGGTTGNGNQTLCPPARLEIGGGRGFLSETQSLPGGAQPLSGSRQDRSLLCALLFGDGEGVRPIGPASEGPGELPQVSRPAALQQRGRAGAGRASGDRAAGAAAQIFQVSGPRSTAFRFLLVVRLSASAEGSH